MKKMFRKILKSVVLGTTVQVAVPKVDNGHGDNQNILVFVNIK